MAYKKSGNDGGVETNIDPSLAAQMTERQLMKKIVAAQVTMSALWRLYCDPCSC